MPRRGSIKTALHNFIEDVGARVYLLDEKREIIYVSSALANWFGESADEMIGKSCLFDLESDYCGIAPSPDAYIGKSVDQRVQSLATNGNDRSAPAKFIPLMDAEGAVVGVLAIVEDDKPAPESHESTKVDLHARLQQAVRRAGHGYDISELVGESPQVRQVREQVQLAAKANCNAVIVGPTGSGRERVARTIHALSTDYEHPSLVPLACPLLDSELLSDTVTAFVRRCAELEAESTPTLLLLDVDELPLDAQADLVGMLEIQEFGIRTLATARRSLVELAEAEEFREDLARDIGTMVISLPPMSARLAEIPLLAQYFVQRSNSAAGRQFNGLSEDALGLLWTYTWPGNLAEFKEVIQEAHQQADPPWIQDTDLPKRLHFARDAAVYGSAEPAAIDLDAFLADVEQRLLKRALRLASGNKAQAARLLGIHRARLLRRIEHFKLSSVHENLDWG